MQKVKRWWKKTNHNIFIITPEPDFELLYLLLLLNFSGTILDAKLIQANLLASKAHIAGFIKKTYFNEKLITINNRVTSNKTKRR